MLGLDGQSFVVDIGSNDGTLLKGYVPYGAKILGVDPSGDPVRIANEQGIETLHAFFNEETSDYVLEHYGQANAITACGVFAHIADLTGVMRGVKKLLAKKGVFATDSQYCIHLFRLYDMEVFDVERSEVYGGSIRVYSCNAGDYPISNRVKELVALEEKGRLYEEATYEMFAQKIEERKQKLFEIIYTLASNRKRVIGIGAPAKATVVCNYCRLGPDLVAYVTEVNPLRIGKYLPGVHIPIVNEEFMFEDSQPADAAILFSWNYYDEIVPKLRKLGFQGEILSP
jgi:SAM-dependent methyltransferase